ncbi:hypothetical protein [Sphingomonas sp. MMS24-J13]|uniref:hypothetical protein n=1 Tax=Sphingomonas sp. MMS24-J13 TaxID=3238686 RepID=UPI0038504BB5
MTTSRARRIDPFASWSRMMAASFQLAQTGVRMVETLSASADVIASRGATIGAAMRSPRDADHAELGRMIPEKLEAFSRSGSAIADAWWAMGSAWMDEAQNLTSLSMRGRVPTIGELAALSDRAAAWSLGTVEAGALLGYDAVAPIHRKATANARRLKRLPAKR